MAKMAKIGQLGVLGSCPVCSGVLSFPESRFSAQFKHAALLALGILLLVVFPAETETFV